MSDTYWTIIPASVRLNNDLMAEAKLLYGDILGLSGREGYCWAKSDYFESITGLSRRQIFRALDQLEREGYIRREGNGPDRKIYPLLSVTQKALDRDKNGTRDHDENGTVLIQSTNTNIIGDIPFEVVAAYFGEWGFTSAESSKLARSFLDYHADGKDSAWKKRAATWKNRAIDFGSVKAPIGPFEEHEVRDEQLGTIDHSKWRKTERGYFRK